MFFCYPSLSPHGMYRRIIKLDTSVDKRKCIAQWSPKHDLGRGDFTVRIWGIPEVQHTTKKLISVQTTRRVNAGHQEPFDFLNRVLEISSRVRSPSSLTRGLVIGHDDQVITSLSEKICFAQDPRPQPMPLPPLGHIVVLHHGENGS